MNIFNSYIDKCFFFLIFEGIIFCNFKMPQSYNKHKFQFPLFHIKLIFKQNKMYNKFYVNLVVQKNQKNKRMQKNKRLDAN